MSWLCELNWQCIWQGVCLPGPNYRTVDKIQKKISKQGKQNTFSRLFHAKKNKGTIATWRSDLNRILHIFNVCFVNSVRPLLTGLPLSD